MLEKLSDKWANLLWNNANVWTAFVRTHSRDHLHCRDHLQITSAKIKLPGLSSLVKMPWHYPSARVTVRQNLFLESLAYIAHHRWSDLKATHQADKRDGRQQLRWHFWRLCTVDEGAHLIHPSFKKPTRILCQCIRTRCLLARARLSFIQPPPHCSYEKAGKMTRPKRKLVETTVTSPCQTCRSNRLTITLLCRKTEVTYPYKIFLREQKLVCNFSELAKTFSI
jgi:hypothetical protein